MNTQTQDFGDDFGDDIVAPKIEPLTAPDVLDDDLLDDDADLQQDLFEETDEERAEREAEEAAAAEAAAAARRIRIPKERHDEAVGRERQRAEAAEQRAQELEQRLQETKTPATPPAAGPTEAQVRQYLDEKQNQYEELLADGMVTEARQIRTEIDRARDYLMEQRVQRMAAETRDSTLTTLKYEQTLGEIERAYPQLNPDNAEAYNEQAALAVSELMNKFVAAGDPQITALAEATRLLLGAPTVTPLRTAASTARTVAARQKAASVMQAQPVRHDLTGRTAAPKALDVTRMSFKAFSDLDEKALSKLRGDEL